MTVNRRLLALLVAHGLAGGIARAQEPATPLYRDASQPIEKRIDDLLGRMTLEEKVGQMNMPCVYVSELGKTIPA
jgi:beta-glucosidase